eukprot:scaffold473_cov104-Isochrysis_galbana.AAC.3
METDAGRDEIPEGATIGYPPAGAAADAKASAPVPMLAKLAGERRLRRWLAAAAEAKSSQSDKDASSSSRSIGTEALEWPATYGIAQAGRGGLRHRSLQPVRRVWAAGDAAAAHHKIGRGRARCPIGLSPSRARRPLLLRVAAQLLVIGRPVGGLRLAHG